MLLTIVCDTQLILLFAGTRFTNPNESRTAQFVHGFLFEQSVLSPLLFPQFQHVFIISSFDTRKPPFYSSRTHIILGTLKHFPFEA